MTTPETATPRQLAERLGYKPHYGNQLAKDGRLVFVPGDPKRVLVAESIARFEATKDPSKTGVSARHAKARAEQGAAADGNYPAAAQQPGPAPAPAGDPAAGGYQAARAVKERYLALEAKRAYEEAMGALRDAREVERLAAGAMTELRLRLEGLAANLAPELAAMNDPDRVKIRLADELHHALESASHHFTKLAAQAVQQP